MTDTIQATNADAATDALTGYTDRLGNEHAFGDAVAEKQVRSDDRNHVFHSWSAQAQINPLPIAAGEGSTFWDYEGNAFLDFSSQLVNLNLGHQHPDLVRAIQDQAGRLATIQPSMASDVRGELARRIAGVAPGDLNKVFFTNGGADANEYAVRMARRVTGRRKVLSMYRSYHGGTSTAISLTGDPRRWANEPSDSSVAHFFGPYLYRSAFHATTPHEETQRALEHLENVIVLEGASTVAAIIIETVVGTNGVLVPPPGYLAGVRALCDKYGIVYIADEVMVGFGRIGEWFAVDAFGRHTRPDHLRQGRQLRLRAARRRRHLRSDRIVLRRPCRSRAGSPTPDIRSPVPPVLRRSTCSSATTSSNACATSASA